MKILFCTDGSRQAENAIRFGGLIAAACQAEATVLGIAESPGHQTELLQHLAHVQQLLSDKAASVEIIAKAGAPIEEIVSRTLEAKYELVVIGAVRKSERGAFWLPAKAYKIIKRLAPPVLVVLGNRARLQHILVCTGGRDYIDKAVELTGRIAAGTKARVTLVHVMAPLPVIYTGLRRQGEDLDRLLNSSTPLGQNLKRVKEAFEALGVPTEVRLLHGEVMTALLQEMRRVDYDLVVAGSTPARGVLRTYVMGDVTREIVNQAECPVLVVRTGEVPNLPAGLGRFLAEIKQAFTGAR
jgi:nucleotide-binding universal stress UspA family protein